MNRPHLADWVLPRLIVLVAVFAVGFTATQLPYFTYDEGVYFYEATEWARGKTPYTEFFVPQPPGILCLGAAADKLGVGIGGVRAVTVLLGWLALLQTYQLGRQITGSSSAGWAAAGFLASTAEWHYTSLEAATQAPTAVGILLAVRWTLSNHLVRAGVLIGLLTLFRLQVVTLLPGLGLAVLLRDGPRTGLIGNLKLALAGVVALGIHGLLAVALPGYWDGVIGFQLDRPRMSWDERSGVIEETLRQPAVLIGCILTLVCLVRSGDRRLVGVITVLTMAITALAGNSLFRPYFIAVLPLLAVCLASTVTELVERFGTPPRAWAVLAVLTAVSSISAIRLQVELNRKCEGHRQFLEEIRTNPAQHWLTSDPRLLLLTGKQMIDDRFATDPGGLFVRHPARFQQWFQQQLAQADAVAFTDMMMGMLEDRTAQAVQKSGKPVVFESDRGRNWFHERTARPLPER